MMPKCSVIIPTYNRAPIIKRAIESVLLQTYQDWELLIVDDCSTDNTQQMIHTEFDDERIKYYKLEVNKGNAGARNKGVEIAKGEYIAFLDSDDEYTPGYLTRALNCISQEENDVDFLWSGTRTIALNGNSVDSIWIPSKESFPNQFLYELHVGIGRGFLIKRKCFADLKFDERLRTAVDTDFLIRLKQSFNYTILKDIVVNIYSQPGSVRSDFSEKKKSYDIIIEKHKEIINNDAFLQYKWYYKLFWLSLYDNDKLLARKAFKKIFYKDLKPLLLLSIFLVFSTQRAISIHRKFSQ